MKTFIKSRNAAGRIFFENELENDFPTLRLIKYPKIQNGIDWISNQRSEKSNELINQLFSGEIHHPLVVEFQKIINKPVEPRYKFADKKKLISKILSQCSEFRFEKIDPQSLMAFTRIGKYRIITEVSASDRLYNITCGHNVSSGNPDTSGPVSLLGSTNLFHGDCWKSDSLNLSEYSSVVQVLSESYKLLKRTLLDLDKADNQ